MTDDDPEIPQAGREQGERLVFVLPLYVNGMGYSCARHWAESSVRFFCGCPRCLKKIGLTLCFHADDWNDTGDMQEHWRKRIVSIKTARLAQYLVVEGYDPER